LIFVVDSNDRDRVDEAADELAKLLNEPQLCTAAVLVLANKQDLPQSMSVAELTDKLGLHSFTSRKWYVQGTSAITSDGIYEGLEWLSTALDRANIVA